jgi:histidyl-tRNA synthetase
MMRRANRLGARYAILIGENEQKDGTLTVKEMMSGEERIVKQDELVGALPGLV